MGEPNRMACASTCSVPKCHNGIRRIDDILVAQEACAFTVLVPIGLEDGQFDAAIIGPFRAERISAARAATLKLANQREAAEPHAPVLIRAAEPFDLAQARALGASLVIGLNSDASARGLGKGPDRPLNAEADRACVLAALESVSLVVLFDEPTPVELLKLVRPQLYVKGGDYDMDKLPETALVKSWGGRALALPFVQGYSTTKLVQRIRAG